MSAPKVDVLGWSPMKVGAGVGSYVVHHGQHNVSAHHLRSDGVYCVLEFGASREAAQRLADKLNASRHVGQTVPAPLARMGAAA